MHQILKKHIYSNFTLNLSIKLHFRGRLSRGGKVDNMSAEGQPTVEMTPYFQSHLSLESPSGK